MHTCNDDDEMEGWEGSIDHSIMHILDDHEEVDGKWEGSEDNDNLQSGKFRG